MSGLKELIGIEITGEGGIKGGTPEAYSRVVGDNPFFF